jgi:hypothetical protein
MFFHGLFDLPFAFEVNGEDDEIAGAEADRIFAVGYGDVTLEYQAGFLFGVCPVEFARLTGPYRPGFAEFLFLFGWLSHHNIFRGRHISLLYSLSRFRCGYYIPSFVFCKPAGEFSLMILVKWAGLLYIIRFLKRTMNKEQLTKYKAWFDKFIAGFYCDNEYINANIKLKEEHTGRVCSEMLYLADELYLTDDKRLLAETIALFHDVGRFPQFAKYQTYVDPKSINHCLLGVEVLQKEKVLAELPENERQIIETAIRYHGEKELPNNLTGDTLLLSKMIRDADKLDIFNVIINAYIQRRDDPDSFRLEVEMPDEPRCTPQVLDAILTGGRIDYRALRTMNDMKLCVLGWVYDVNFVPTLLRLKERRYLETIFSFLPDTPDIRKAREKIFAYVDSRLRAG